MGYKMKGHALPGPFQKKIWPPGSKQFDVEKDVIEKKHKKKQRSDDEKDWLDFADTLDEIKVDPNKKLPSNSSLEKYHPE
jgi:hypothetical protein